MVDRASAMDTVHAFQSKPLSKQVVQCTACEHWCAVGLDEVGKCHVRMNRNGQLVSLVYGRAAAAHVDPVEKKPLFHFLPGQPVFSIGTLGCNFHCQFCQNWQISQPGRAGRRREPEPSVEREKRSGEIARRLARSGQHLPPEEIVSICRARGVPMIAYTYNEPTVYYEYTFDTARLAFEHGIRNIYVTNGFQTLAAIDSIAPYLHAMNVDLKGYTEQFYRATCGGRLEPVLRNIEYVAQRTDIWIEVTTLVVPGMNDSDAELRDIAQFLASVSCDLPWHISAFHPDYHIRDRPATPRERLERAYTIGIEAGLRYVYVGNLTDPERTNTYCPQCGEALIHRMWYEARPVWLEPPHGDLVDGEETGLPGECPECGTVIAGVWQ